MAPGTILKSLTALLLFIGPALSIPSTEGFNFDKNALSLLHARSGPLEVRGVYGGRKKRFIIERQAGTKTCCTKKKCPTAIGQILDKNCKCTKCGKGTFPSLDGRICEAKCPAGQEDNGKGGCCPKGEKPNAAGDKCEKGTEDDNNKNRKGNCPDDLVLDPRAGSTPDDPKPKCQIDDEKTCKKPKLPATRPEGSELDKNLKVDCGDPPDEKDRAKCDSKSQYVDRWVVDGKTYEKCEYTKRYNDSKKKKIKNEKFQARQKEQWNRDKPARDKADKDRKDKLKKLNDIKDARQKALDAMADRNEDIKSKKKARMSKCAPAAALMMGSDILPPWMKREEPIVDHPYEWTTEFFDEAFVEADEFLGYWPNDVDVETIKYPDQEHGVNADAFIDFWSQKIANQERSYRGGLCQKRSLDDEFDEFDLEPRGGANNTLVERYMAETRKPENGTPTEIMVRDPTEIMVRDPNVYVKRNPLGFLIQIAIFALRLGMSMLVRATRHIARLSPRLRKMADELPDRLFQLGKKGQSLIKPEQMKNAMNQIAKNPHFKQCIREGIPGK